MRTPPALLIGALTIFTACTRVGSIRPVAADPVLRAESGESKREVPRREDFEGLLHLGVEAFVLSLQVDHLEGDVVEAMLRIDDLGLEATGEGTFAPDRLRLSLRYGGTCEGTLVVAVRLSEGGHVGDGMVEAEDCTGRESGALTLARRPDASTRPQVRPR